MKKIDLHIHTVPTVSDSAFTFSMDTFKRYVTEAHLDAVAVTNHDVFDVKQFRQIQKELQTTVFPGIEINVDKGHVLVITELADLDDFEKKAARVSEKIRKQGDSISVDLLQEIYGDLSKYLVIPHYDKMPSISADTLSKLLPYICAGEVDSPKKFVRNTKDGTKLTPVLFSDARMKADLPNIPLRQTFIDCGDVSLSAIKACLRDQKVALSEKDGNELLQVFEDGQKISTGLNVLVGPRSSGKTHMLDAISASMEGVKYIRQFSLVQQDEAGYEKDFRGRVERKRGFFVDEYLAGLKRVLEDVVNVDLAANDREVTEYMASLLKAAVESDRRDIFSKAALFAETNFPVGTNKALEELYASLRHIIENVQYRDVIEKHVELIALKRLAIELIELMRARAAEFQRKRQVNSLVRDIRERLQVLTGAVQVKDVDLYEVALDVKRIQRFVEIVGFLMKQAVVHEESIQGFRIEARREPYTGAQSLRNANGGKGSFTEAFGKYHDPYEYLCALRDNDSVNHADLYKLFSRINYRVLNRDGFEVSGGERSEFRLLQEISDAQNFEILLVDEPESSFDNLFLKSDVNQILKAISETMPVVVVTHNNTVGASVKADYVLYTKKELENGVPAYRIYSGYPTDMKLCSIDGKEIPTHEVLMNSLEAGPDAYEGRRKRYEAIKG